MALAKSAAASGHPETLNLSGKRRPVRSVSCCSDSRSVLHERRVDGSK